MKTRTVVKILAASAVVGSSVLCVGTAVATTGDMPAGGISVVYKKDSTSVGTDAGWDTTSMQKDDQSVWSIECKQTAWWGQIKWQIPLAEKAVLKEIAFDTDLVGWDNDRTFEARVTYIDGTKGIWHRVPGGFGSITLFDPFKKVDYLEISEGQWGWFQMKVDYIYAIRK